MEQKLAIGAIVALGIAMRLLAGYLDKGRIEMYAAKQGWNILDRRWSPLGSWWFGGTYSRIYRMVYRDPRGNVHKAYVRTSMFSGVYLTGDHIVERAGQSKRRKKEARLETEKRRPRARIADSEQGRK